MRHENIFQISFDAVLKYSSEIFLQTVNTKQPMISPHTSQNVSQERKYD